MLVVIVGLAGLGKSTTAERLIDKGVVLENDVVSDVLRSSLKEVYGLEPNDRDSLEYMEKIKPYEYRNLFNVIGEQLRMGQTVILPITFMDEVGREDGWEHIQKNIAGYKIDNVEVVHLYMSDKAAWKKRLEERNHPDDKYKFDNWKEYSGRADKYEVKWKGIEVGKIDVLGKTREEVEKEVREYLDRRKG